MVSGKSLGDTQVDYYIGYRLNRNMGNLHQEDRGFFIYQERRNRDDISYLRDEDTVVGQT